MKIGIDAHVLGKNLGGVERFIFALINNLPNESPNNQFVVFVTKQAYAQYKNQSTEQVEYVPLAFSNPLFERLILLPWLARKHRLDGLIVQRLVPWFCGSCKLIATIHDLTPIKFASGYRGLSNTLIRLLTKNTIKRSDLILTPTQVIADEIKQYCPNVKAPIRHFYNGVDSNAFTIAPDIASNHTGKKYLLTVGAIERRKNIETIINMLPKLSDKTIKLYIMGGIRDALYFDELFTLVEKLNLQGRVQYLGFMSELEMIACYQKATMFITASKDEGFNIPPLESMACGVPVACSSIPVHLELFEGAAIFFKAESIKDLHFKVQSALDNQHITDELISNGLSKVKQFTWQQSAKKIAAALNEVTP